MKEALASTLLAIAVAAASPAWAKQPDSNVIPLAATYGQPDAPRVALFLSGDGGWNLGVVSMAQAVAKRGYFVAGIDFPKYLHSRDKAPCIALADDLEATASALAHERSPKAGAPWLIGYSSGATAVYGALSQANAGRFAGGLSLGFAPDLKTTHPFCKEASLSATPDPRLGFIYGKVSALATPWKALQGEIDQDVSAAATRTFVEGIGNAEIIMLPRVGHGFSVERNWMPQFQAALHGLETIAERH